MSSVATAGAPAAPPRKLSPVIPVAILVCLLAAAALAVRFGVLTAHPFGLFADTTPQAGQELGGDPAPDFTLTDQNGQTASLSGLRGKAVVVAFFYTNCQDTCPLTAAKFAQMERELSPADRGRLQLLAVTVDPKGDTAAARQQFVAQHGLAGQLSYLSGSMNTLQSVWHDYAIGVNYPPDPAAPGGYDVQHTEVSYLVDPQGHERVLIDDSEFTPDQLVHDVRMVLGET